MASRLEYLIDVLKSEQGQTELEIPEKVEEQEVLYRALQNVRYPAPVCISGRGRKTEGQNHFPA